MIALAGPDPRIVGAAVVGGLAEGAGDRWSDLDLTFAVDDDVPMAEVLADWTRAVADELDGAAEEEAEARPARAELRRRAEREVDLEAAGEEEDAVDP